MGTFIEQLHHKTFFSKRSFVEDVLIIMQIPAQ